MFLSSNSKINVTLCGMMGSGKSVTGKMLAKKINFKFVDTDVLIEKKTGKSINSIFKEDGEESFRSLEKKIIINILKKKNYVISLGGGSILNNEIRNSIKLNSYNIYLEVNTEILNQRLINSKKRPLINNKNTKETLKQLIKKREKFYQEADLIIKNELSIKNALDNIINSLKNNE